MSNHNPLPRSTPEAQGVPSRSVKEFITEVEKQAISLHSFMLLRCGEVIAEGWWEPYQPNVPHMLFSLTKSFTSTAVGMAVAEGRLDVHDPVLKFFSDDAPKKVSPNLAAMQVHHLLSMSTGHDQDTTERSMRRRNPFKAFLALPVEHAPGTHFVYNSQASNMLAAIVQKLTGQTVLEYLTPRLFEPLGITSPRWESHRSGVNYGGWGLNITTEDIARFGQLYLQNGVWDGQRLIPTSWVQAATSKQVSNGTDTASDWAQGYGYQFWRCRHNAYRGDGAFGQYCVVMPDQAAVLAMTGGVPDMQVVLNIAWDTLLPGLQQAVMEEPGPSQSAAQPKTYLSGLKLPPVQGALSSPLAASLSGRVFSFEANFQKLDSMRFDFSANTLYYRLQGRGASRGTHQIRFGIMDWVAGTAALGPLGIQPAAASGAWTAEDTFVLSICQYETPFMITFTCRFDGDKMFLGTRVNVNFGPTEFPETVGAAG